MTIPNVSRSDTRSNEMNGHRTTCFYCGEPEGKPHKFKCVCNTRTIKVRYSWETEREVPAFWEDHTIDYHMNESSWCADNALEELIKKYADDHGPCSCGAFSAEILE